MEESRKITTSLCLPSEISNQLDSIALELNVSRSSVATAMLTIMCKWSKTVDIQEVLNSGIARW